MKPKNNDKKFYIGFAVVLYLLSSIVICHALRYMSINQDTAFIVAIQACLNETTFTHPFAFLPITLVMRQTLFKYTLVYIVIAYLFILENEKNRRDAIGIESGSAKWNDDINGYNKKYSDPPKSTKHNGPYNMILSNDLYLNLNTFITRKNNNVLIVGGSGSGKSRFYVKPNVLQANTSFVITDPAGELLESMGGFLKEQGYALKVFNLCEMQFSNCYNPFDYIRDDLGVMQLVNCLIKNTTPPEQGRGDPFWEKSETELYKALIFYLMKERPPEERNFTSIMRLLRAAEIDENNPNAESALDLIFKKLPDDHMAKKSYRTFKMGAGKTLKSILISCAVRIGVFDLKAVSDLTRTDTINPENNMELEKAGDRKTAIFVIIPAADDTYNFLVSMMYSQFFETLYYHAENRCPHQYRLVNGHETLLVSYDEADMKKQIENLQKGTIIKCNPEKEEKENEKDQISNNKAHAIVNENGTSLKTFYNEELAQEFLKQIKLFDTKQDRNMPLLIKNNLIKIKDRIKSKKFIDLIDKLLFIEPSVRIVRGEKRLPYHIRFILDEFANIGTIPEFDKKLATMRKYEISCNIILQNLAQLQEMYEKKWGGIVGNCSSFVFLGSPEYDTDEYVSKMLGDATIVVRNNSRSRGKSGSSSLSFNKTSRKLMLPDELFRNADDKCIVLIQGLFPFFTDKFNYPTHPNYKFTGDNVPQKKYYCKNFFNNGLADTNELDCKIEKEKCNKITEVVGTKKEEEIISTPASVDSQEMLDVLNIKEPNELKDRKLILKKNGEPEEWQFDTFSE